MKKICSRCLQLLPIDLFRFDNKKKGYRKSRCSACENERMREDRKANGDKRRANDREAYARNADRVYRNNLKQRYGLTDEQVERIVSTAQCDICGRFAGEHKLVVDHCHTVGTKRGVLCRQCNAGLGQFQDNPGLLREAARYIEAGGFGSLTEGK